MARKRMIKTEEFELWRRATRGVEPLAGRRPPPGTMAAADAGPVPAREPPAGDAPPAPPPARRMRLGAQAAPAARPPAGPGRIEPRLLRRLRRGQAPIDASLDMHGLRAAEAERDLERFLRTARARGARCVIVVTGKGRDGPGILRRALPVWLASPEMAAHVLAYDAAGPRHGGAGAFYLVLRGRGGGGR